MRIYISGKITGLKIEDAHSSFFEAEEQLKYVFPNATIVNPVRETSHLSPTLHTWEMYMAICMEKLLYCTHIHMVNESWIDSRGAKVEKAIADSLNLETVEI